MLDGLDFFRLLVDELPEFGLRNLETLRQPLEDHVITIARAAGSLTYPANFVLISAMNPCPQGSISGEHVAVVRFRPATNVDPSHQLMGRIFVLSGESTCRMAS